GSGRLQRDGRGVLEPADGDSGGEGRREGDELAGEAQLRHRRPSRAARPFLPGDAATAERGGDHAGDRLVGPAGRGQRGDRAGGEVEAVEVPAVGVLGGEDEVTVVCP